MLKKKQEPPYYTRADNIKKYIALLTQTGTSAPIQNVILNTLGLDLEWLRAGTGDYYALGNFTQNKTTGLISGNGTDGLYGIDTGDGTYIGVKTYDFTGTPDDDILINTTIELTIYP